MEESSKPNSEDVIMPWDDLREIIYTEENNEVKVYSRWDLIQKMLDTSTKIKNVNDLIKVITSYNVSDGQENKPHWRFPVLREYFTQLSDLERNQFFKDGGLLSSIRNVSLLLRELLPKCKILKTGFNSSIRLHQIQVASILANAFFCTFPKGKADCPSINFNMLFEGQSSSVLQHCVEKIKCIIHYFKRLYEKKPTGYLIFCRHIIPDHKFPRWDKTTATLCSLKVDTKGRIEDQNGFIHMDFSNRYVGGGVLGRGCVQEEIRFVICPELIAARLFTECLADNESLSVIGAERYCTYRGYSNTFSFAGDYKDRTPFDCNGVRKTYLTIIDALYFHNSSEQYRESKILRELKKAYVGFMQNEGNENLPLATGNWGCGAFGGDPQLKSLIQIMASSQARRDMLYLTFGDSTLKSQIEEIYMVLRKKDINVGELYRIIRLYNRERRNQSLFEFILAYLQKPEKRKFHSTSTMSLSRKSTTPSPLKQSVSEKESKILNISEKSIETNPKNENQRKSQTNCEGSSKSDKSFNSTGYYSMSDYIKIYGRAGITENHNSVPKICDLSEENMFDVIWYENECDPGSGSRVRPEHETDKCEKKSPRLSPSLFTDDDEEMTCEESVNERESENAKNQEATDSRKVVQSKITDFF